MCPACILSTAGMVAGAGSTGGILAVCIGKFRKLLREWSRPISENKGEVLWQRTKRERRSTRKGTSR
jgi:hypothetical protein